MSTPSFEERLAALTARVEALEIHSRRVGDGAPQAAPKDATVGPPTTPTTPDTATPPTDPSDPMWALHELERRVPSPGGVLFTGSVTTPEGPVRYQWGRTATHLHDSDWKQFSNRASALGHPLRLALLQLLLDGERTVTELVEALELSSPSIAYHHLSTLQAAGWATAARRGAWSIPPSRIIPLLTIVTALEMP